MLNRILKSPSARMLIALDLALICGLLFAGFFHGGIIGAGAFLGAAIVVVMLAAGLYKAHKMDLL